MQSGLLKRYSIVVGAQRVRSAPTKQNSINRMIYANKKKKKKKEERGGRRRRRRRKLTRTVLSETKVGRQFHVVNVYNMKILYSFDQT